MDDKFNTIAGWALFSGIVAWGISSVSAHYFKAERPEHMGYKIAGVVEEGKGGAAEAPIAVRLATADPAKGEGIFKKCMSCHTINQGGPNGIGPNLYGVLGEAIGKGANGYAFSPDLAAVGGKWDFEKIDKWLTSPKAMVAGTKMSFAGLDDPMDRANIIAYINKQGSNLPLPAVPAAGAAPAAGASGAAAPAASGAAAPAPADAAKK
jgi:cytochrome c